MKNEIQYVPEELDFDKLPKDQLKRVNTLFHVSLSELIERWSKSQSYAEDGKILNDDYFDVPIILRSALNIINPNDVNKSIDSIKKAIDDLEAKFRNHRHETGKTYSAKPEY